MVMTLFCILAVVVDKQTMTKLCRVKHTHVYNEMAYLNKFSGLYQYQSCIMYYVTTRGNWVKGYVGFLSIVSPNFA